MVFQQPDSDDHQRYRPKSCNAVQIEYVEIAEEIDAADNHEGHATPEFSVLNVAELLLKSVDRCFQHDSFCAQLAFLRGVIRLEWHVEVKRRGSESEQCCVRCIRHRHESAENQYVDGSFDKFAVVDCANAWNQTKRKRSAGITSGHNFVSMR